MAMRRMIASAIWDDEWFGELDFFEQAMWIGLFSKCADDQGRLRDNPYLIRSNIFPYKDIGIEEIGSTLEKFERDERIIRYQADGKSFVQIVNWWEHQPMQWAARSRFPAPTGWIDRVRTRSNNRYIEENWHGTAELVSAEDENESSPECSPERSGEHSGEEFSCDAHVGRHVPNPVPVPNPVSEPVRSTSLCEVACENANSPPDGGGARAPCSPDPPKPENSNPKRATPRRRSAPREPPPPAVQVFHANTQRYPAKSLWPDIDRIVGHDPPDIRFWQDVVKAYIGQGWNPGNVNGMLDFFRRGEIPPGNGRGSYASNSGHAGRPQSDGHSAADIERILAERVSEVRRSGMGPPLGETRRE